MMCEVSLVGLEGLLILLVYWLYWMEWDGSRAAYRRAAMPHIGWDGQLCCISTGGYAAYQTERAARLHWMERQLCCISTGGYAAYRTGRAAALHIERNGS